MAEEKTEAPELTPAQVKENELCVTAEPIIDAGFAGKLDEGTIKTNMVVGGIDFTQVNKIFKRVAIAKGYIVDPAVVKEALDAQIKESQWDSIESYDQLEAVCTEISEEVKGSTLGQVLKAAKAAMEAAEIPVPEQVAAPKATRAKGGKAARAIVDLFATNKKATKAEAYVAVLPCGKAHKNAVDNLKIHYLTAFGCANGMTADEAFEATKDEAWPAETPVTAEAPTED